MPHALAGVLKKATGKVVHATWTIPAWTGTAIAFDLMEYRLVCCKRYREWAGPGPREVRFIMAQRRQIQPKIRGRHATTLRFSLRSVSFETLFENNM
eukprot:2531547-Prymnesium_polylepis.1